MPLLTLCYTTHIPSLSCCRGNGLCYQFAEHTFFFLILYSLSSRATPGTSASTLYFYVCSPVFIKGMPSCDLMLLQPYFLGGFPLPLPLCLFQEVPATWIPASGVDVVNGVLQPDQLGHTPGAITTSVDH